MTHIMRLKASQKARVRAVLTAAVATAGLLGATSTAADAHSVSADESAAPVAIETLSDTSVAADIKVSCEGTQESIDNCVGATNYEPISNYLGVPYYAQHNGMGGEAWLDLKVGDIVAVEDVHYVVTEVRTVTTGGDIDQIADMHADAYLQTCFDNPIDSEVLALARV